ncbi:helix-turn-helix domain-containing protein [Sphingomonas sp. Leaf17]|uniref:helix-turn-helix domain-containing protein n=1 Tax=Sphingomonas sp. Leaf17 TaxID=1735683 RepID=UPI00138F7E6E|nr:helix-turn-helix domain-containing protein [Sphingomonas sp. Leaf17]
MVSSADVGGPAALASYRQAVDSVFACILPDRTSEADYTCDIMAWHLGTLMFGSFRSSALCFDRSADRVAMSGMDHILVQLYLEGRFTGRADDRPITVGSGDICLFDMCATLDTCASDFHNLSFMVPRAFFDAGVGDAAALHGVVLSADRPQTALLADYITALARRLPMLGARDAEAAASATILLLTTVLGTCDRSQPVDRPRRDPSPFRAIALYIDRHAGDAALEPGRIAAAFNISRATLYRIFEPVGGVSDYIRRRRLTGAAIDLAAIDGRRRKVAEIAYRWGFANEATFGRAFKAHFGITPGMARNQQQRTWLAKGCGDPDNAPERRFDAWLKTLRK